MDILTQVIPLMSTIRNSISLSDFDNTIIHQGGGEYVDTTTTIIDIDEERRNLLRQEAMDAVQYAAIAKTNYEILVYGESLSLSSPTDNNSSNKSKTHTVTRASHIEAKKVLDKAEKRAQVLMKRAKDAGAILDDDTLVSFVDKNQWDATIGFGSGGLMNRTEQEIYLMQQSLLPEGTKQYYDQRGLPTGTIIENTDTMERVIIPSIKMDETILHQRLYIQDIISDTDLVRAFDGTQSLNPMQSETFHVAFHSRDNMLVCAPVRFFLCIFIIFVFFVF